MTLLNDGSLGRLRELLIQTDSMEEREGIGHAQTHTEVYAPIKLNVVNAKPCSLQIF